MSPGASVALNEYACPHLGQKPSSRLSGESHPEHTRFRSGTVPGTKDASGSSGASGGLASGRPPPSARDVLRDDRVDPERVLRVLLALRADPVEGVRPDPVFVDAGPAWELAVARPVVAAACGAAAMPQALQ
jgi:hypothetical protein